MRRLCVASMLILAASVSCSSPSQSWPVVPSQSAVPYTPPPPVMVNYTVSGLTGYGETASVTYATTTGTSQMSVALNNKDVRVLSSGAFDLGDFLYVSIQADGYGFANCKIEVGGEVISSNTAGHTPYGIATCQGQR